MIKNCLSAASMVALTLTMSVSTQAFAADANFGSRCERPRGRGSIVEARRA